MAPKKKYSYEFGPADKRVRGRRGVEGYISLVGIVVGVEGPNGRRPVRISYTGADGKNKTSSTSVSDTAGVIRLIRRWATDGAKVIIEDRETGKRHTYVKKGARYIGSTSLAGSRRASAIAAESGGTMAKKSNKTEKSTKITMVRIRIGAEKGGVRSVSVTRGKKTVTGSLEGSEAAQKKGLQRLIRAWCRTGVKVVMTVEGSKEVCTYCKEGTRYVCTKSTRTTVRRKPTAAKPGRKPAKPGRKPAKPGRKPAKPTATKPGRKPGRKVSAYNKFVAAQRKAGKTMKQAAAAWRAHKAETGKTEVMAKPRRKPVSATAKTEVMAKPKARKAKAKKTAKPKATKAKTAAKPKARKAKAKKTTKKTGRKVSAYNKFVAAQRKAGKSMKEAAAAWRAQGGGAKKATKAKAKKSTKAKATAKPKARKAKSTKAKTTKASSAALPAVGDVVAAAALRSARRKHGTVKTRGKRK